MEKGIDIPEQLITTDYLLDPATEDILFDGNELKEGMVVLIEHAGIRKYSGTPLQNLSAEERRTVLATARWCRIERLVIEERLVRFIGVYADGSKCVREYGKSHSWIVKLNSIPE